MNPADLKARVDALEGQVLSLAVRLELMSLPWWRRVRMVLGQTTYVMPNGSLWFDDSVFDMDDTPLPIGELDLRGRWSFLFGGCGCGMEEMQT